MKYNYKDMYIGDIIKRDNLGNDKIYKSNESLIYMEDEDMFMVIDDYLNYIFESFYASDRLSKEQLEKNKLMAIKSLLPYKNIKNDCLYVDESSIKLLGTENKKVK